MNRTFREHADLELPLTTFYNRHEPGVYVIPITRESMQISTGHKITVRSNMDSNNRFIWSVLLNLTSRSGRQLLVNDRSFR